MFSVRFCHIYHVSCVCRVPRRNDFCLSCQNHLSYILVIWANNKYIWPKVMAVASISKIGLFAWSSKSHSSDHYKHSSSIALVIVITMLDFGKILLEAGFFFGKFFIKNVGWIFSRTSTFLTITQEWSFGLIWNKKDVHRLDTWYNMTLTFDLTHDLDFGCFKV